jgi:hypothetical protein
MMEAVRTSETSVDNHSTRQYNPEDSSEHYTRRRENLKSHKFVDVCDNYSNVSKITKKNGLVKMCILQYAKCIHRPQTKWQLCSIMFKVSVNFV